MLLKRKNYAKKLCESIILILIISKANGQEIDTIKNDVFSLHAQTTIINQFKPAFRANYNGENSLSSSEENKISITSTIFLGINLWKNASVFISPEIGGGSGLSGSLGVGASTNGETYRIANPAPAFELGRLYFKQIFSDFSFTIGKVSISDYFDNNKYSHDPRTQFMSWALMSNSAWDYPANTKGYTPSIILEYTTPKNELRYAFSLVSTTPNGMIMNWNINEAGSHTLEYTYKWNNGALRLLSFFTTANMGNYDESILLNSISPNIHDTEKQGRTKYGFGINYEQEITKNIGVFFRTSWNDGRNETWEFTEIDRSISIGISSNGNQWNRKNDNIGLAYVISGLSTSHRNYLQAGGMGFELGDGNLNYGLEQFIEIYYSLGLTKNIYTSGAYQFIMNPGYNKDRGPVNVFSIRLHVII